MSQSTKRGEYRPIYSVILDSPEYQALTPHAKLLVVTLKLRLGPAGIGIVYDEELQECTSLEDIEGPRQELIDGNWLLVQGRIHWLRNGFRFEPAMHVRNEKHRVHLERVVQGLPRLGIVLLFTDYYEIQRPFEKGPLDGIRHAPSWTPLGHGGIVGANGPGKGQGNGAVDAPPKGYANALPRGSAHALPRDHANAPPRGSAEAPREVLHKQNRETNRLTHTPAETDSSKERPAAGDGASNEAAEADPVDRLFDLHPAVRPILEQMKHRGGLEATLSTLRMRFLSRDDVGVSDPCLAGLDVDARLHAVAAALVEMQDQGVTEWNPRYFAGFVRRLRATEYTGPAETDAGSDTGAHRELKSQMARIEAAEIEKKNAEAKALQNAVQEAQTWLASEGPEMRMLVESRILERLRGMGFKGDAERAPGFMRDGILPEVVRQLREENADP